jgi:hypothetical protein
MMEWDTGSNILIRPNSLPNVGDSCGGHSHNFDHTTLVLAGAVHVVARFPDGRRVEADFKAPAHFLVKAEVAHDIVATQPDTLFWCVYAHRDPQGEVVQRSTGWGDAYV